MRKVFTAFLVFAFVNASSQTTWPDKVGIGLGGIGGVAMEFVDASKTMRDFSGTTVDSRGYPLGDFNIVVFDARPCCPWLGSVDDPSGFVPKLTAGSYKMQFTGKAVIQTQSPGISIRNQEYDAGSNRTTLELVVPTGSWLVVLNFTQTQRTATSATNTGITDITLLRPGYHNRPQDVYRKEFLNAVSLFPVIRFMDFVKTNNTNPLYPGTTEWATRKKPDNALFHEIAPWEYVVELANITGKDIWINIPVAASDNYVSSLATFLKNSLTNPDVKIYFEYSNEVWNGGFTQYTYNRSAAVAEVQAEIAGGAPSTLNDEAGQCDRNDQYLWAGRRYVRRMKEIGDIFIETFSPGSRASFGTKIRPVFAWQIGGWIPWYSCILTWFESVYGQGSAKNNFYGLAGAAYVNAEGAPATATADAILQRMTTNSNAGRGSKRTSPNAWTSGTGKIGLREIADLFQIRLLQYETGPDNGGGSPENIANRITANRVAGIRDVLNTDLRNNWFADPDIRGDLIMYFVLSSGFNRYGSWGATEEIENMHTNKLKALYSLMGIQEDLDAPTAPGNVVVTLNGSNATVTWNASTDNRGVSHYRIYDVTGAVATVLANETRSVTIPNVTAGQASSIRVTAIDFFNNETGQLITSVRADAAMNELVMYPVPATSQLSIVLPDNVGPVVSVKIYDQLGKQVISKLVQMPDGDDTRVAVDVSALPRGVYQVKAEGRRSVHRGRLVLE